MEPAVRWVDAARDSAAPHATPGGSNTRSVRERVGASGSGVPNEVPQEKEEDRGSGALLPPPQS